MKDVEDLADRVAFLEGGRIKLSQSRGALESWRIIEGTCEGSLSVEAVRFKLDRGASSSRFKMLTDHYSEELLNELRARGATVTGVFIPDLEEIYNWVINTSRE
jgi:ABC-type multidrug transport system ATPase subunit